MSKKYTPAIFQPTLRPSWAGALYYIPQEEKSLILEALVNYPKEIEINSRFWEETIKPDLEIQYQTFVNTCLARGRGAKSYWEAKGIEKDNLSISYDELKYNSLKDKDKNKDKDKIKNNRYGECKNVLLTEEQYKNLSELDNFDLALEKLDTWLGTSGSKNRNKNHYAYFKSNSWVWKDLKPKKTETEEIVFIDEHTRMVARKDVLPIIK